MTKVSIDPGVCGFKALVTAESEDQQEVTIRISSGCQAVQGMMEQLGNPQDAYELCLGKPGTGPLYQYAAQHFPGHCACPVLSGILKCVEAECGLALKRDVEIRFL
jgi:hypothetical protein